jgi:hypothetical protein
MNITGSELSYLGYGMSAGYKFGLAVALICGLIAVWIIIVLIHDKQISNLEYLHREELSRMKIQKLERRFKR